MIFAAKPYTQRSCSCLATHQPRKTPISGTSSLSTLSQATLDDGAGWVCTLSMASHAHVLLPHTLVTGLGSNRSYGLAAVSFRTIEESGQSKSKHGIGDVFYLFQLGPESELSSVQILGLLFHELRSGGQCIHEAPQAIPSRILQPMLQLCDVAWGPEASSYLASALARVNSDLNPRHKSTIEV